MFLREIASSQHNARQKGKHAAVRAMLRDTRLNSISVIAGKKIKRHIFVNKSNMLTLDLFTRSRTDDWKIVSTPFSPLPLISIIHQGGGGGLMVSALDSGSGSPGWP